MFTKVIKQSKKLIKWLENAYHIDSEFLMFFNHRRSVVTWQHPQPVSVLKTTVPAQAGPLSDIP